MTSRIILGQFIVCAIIPFIVAKTSEGKKDINVAVNDLYKQCGEEIAAKNGSIEVGAANFSSRSYSSFSQLRTEIKEKKQPTNYVTPSRPESESALSGDLVRMELESLAKMIPSTEMERYYCTFTRIGFLSKNGDLIPSSISAKCSTECQALVSGCVTHEDVKDTEKLHEKAYRNVMCIYISNWLLHGFAP